jgi:hypothetical protein
VGFHHVTEIVNAAAKQEHDEEGVESEICTLVRISINSSQKNGHYKLFIKINASYVKKIK